MPVENLLSRPDISTIGRMGTKTIHYDDLDQSETDVRTIQFAVEGVSYAIDLSEKNQKKFRDALATYVDHAKRLGGRAARSGGQPAKRDKEQLQAIRAWWRSQGNEMPERGRIPISVEEAYDAAHRS